MAGGLTQPPPTPCFSLCTHTHDPSLSLSLSQALAFNARVEDLARATDRELRQIEQRRLRVAGHASVLTAEMGGAFHGLESLVLEGRELIANEHARQVRRGWPGGLLALPLRPTPAPPREPLTLSF